MFRINAVEDHLHILSSLHPAIAMADFIKDIRLSSGIWIRENQVFPHFTQWQDGYGGFTHSLKEKPQLIEYIKNQQEHHKR